MVSKIRSQHPHKGCSHFFVLYCVRESSDSCNAISVSMRSLSCVSREVFLNFLYLVETNIFCKGVPLLHTTDGVVLVKTSFIFAFDSRNSFHNVKIWERSVGCLTWLLL